MFEKLWLLWKLFAVVSVDINYVNENKWYWWHKWDSNKITH